MPQMEIKKFNNPGNLVLLDEIHALSNTEYQNRIPLATKAGLEATMDALWQYQPGLNQVMDSLVNLIGAQEIKNITWSNPLAKFKRGLLSRGETFEEVAVGLLKAKTYNQDADALEQELFGRDPNNVHTAFHKINRAEYYKLTVTEVMLERAFLTQNGLGNLVNSLMESIGTSDQVDEFEETVSTLRRYYDRHGFYTIKVPDIADPASDSNDAKQFLRVTRAMAKNLTFVSKRYNARHIERVSKPTDLTLILTPEGEAAIDVEALSAAFNEDKAKMPFRVITIPAEKVNIPGFQGILTTDAFWIIADNIMRMGQTNNPVGMYNNYFWHHQEIISASPFENAVLFSSVEGETIRVNNYVPTGIRPFTITDIDGDTYQNITVTNDAATLTRGEVYLVQTAATTVRDTDGAAGPDGAVILKVIGNQSLRTRINQQGVLFIGLDENASTITVNVSAVGDGSFDRDLTINLTGSQLKGSVRTEIDDNPGALRNTRLPGITPQGGPVGTELTVNHGSWDTDDLTFTTQWTRDGADINGATGQQYLTVTADGGHDIAARVTAAKNGQTGASAVAKAVHITPAQ